MIITSENSLLAATLGKSLAFLTNCQTVDLKELDNLVETCRASESRRKLLMAYSYAPETDVLSKQIISIRTIGILNPLVIALPNGIRQIGESIRSLCCYPEYAIADLLLIEDILRILYLRVLNPYKSVGEAVRYAVDALTNKALIAKILHDFQNPGRHSVEELRGGIYILVDQGETHGINREVLECIQEAGKEDDWEKVRRFVGQIHLT